MKTKTNVFKIYLFFSVFWWLWLRSYEVDYKVAVRNFTGPENLTTEIRSKYCFPPYIFGKRTDRSFLVTWVYI